MPSERWYGSSFTPAGPRTIAVSSVTAITGPEHREGRHHLLAPPRRLNRDGQGDEDGQHDESDRQVGAQRAMAGPARHMALEP